MGFLRQAAGLCLMLTSWFNLLSLTSEWRIILFIIGFDLVSLFPKLIIFGLDFFFELLEPMLAWTVLLLIIAELLARFLISGFLLDFIVKPLILFLVAYFNGLNVPLCLLVSLIGVAINLLKK